MKRKEFIEAWTQVRSAMIREHVKNGEWRMSEGAMALAELPKEAIRMWRRNAIRWGLRHTTKEELLKDLMRDEKETKPADGTASSQ